MTTNYCRLTSRLSLRIAFALIACALLNSSAAAKYLYNRMDLPTGQTPLALVAADFNRDGILDLAVVNRDDNTVSILLATPYGTFAPQVTYATGPMPVAVVAADFNGDGKLDLAIADQNCASTCAQGVGNGLVSILLGNGDGTFQPAVNYPVGSLPIGIVAADFNGDGKVGLAVANNPDSTVSTLIGNGDGTFRAGTPVPLPGYPQTIAAGDFNGDGKVDLIVLNSVVSVLLSNGDGTFNRVDTSLIAFPSVGIAVGDFNGDGKLDAVVGDTSPLGFYQPQVLLGRGDGTFEIQPSTALLTNVISADGIIAADFNHDGILDIAFSGHGVGAAASIALGIGDGTFQFPILSVPVTNGSPIVVGDFNGDGRLDVATVNEPGSVSILLGSGDGSFGHEADFGVDSPGYIFTGPEVVADFNGDGKLDVAVRTTPGTVTGGAVKVVLGHGDGTLSSPVSSVAGSAGLYAMASGDFNSDGKMDVIVDDGGSVSVLLGNGDGSFQAPINTIVGATYTVQKIVTGDFNGDGKVDAAVIVYDSSMGRYELVILTGSGTGTFTVGPPYVPPDNGWINSLVVADFNGDGKLDLALLDQNNSAVLVLLGRGDGSFQNAVSYPVADTEILGVGDFNGDGKLDLVAVSEFGTSALLGNGDGTFRNHVDSAVPRITSYQLNTLAIADFNGDGKQDLATYSGGAFILLGNGDGTFRLPYMYHDTTYNGGFQGVVAAGDFNGDGTPDLVIAGEPPTAVPSVTLLLSAPMANLAPPGLTFASEVIGTPSAPEDVALTNIGNAPLDLINVGLPSGDFSQTNTCSNLAPGANCALNITFTPTAGGSRAGTLTLTDNASNNPQAVGLAGTGTAPSASLSATSLSFGNQSEGTSSAAQAVTVTNNGTAPLTFSSIAVTGEFAVAASGTTCSTSAPLAASGSCVINVTFAPAASGALSGNLTLTDQPADRQLERNGDGAWG